MCSALAKLRVAGSRRGVVEVPARLRALLAEVKGSSWLGPQPLAQALRSSAPELTASEADSLNAYLLGPSGTGPLTVLHGLRLCPLARGGLALFQRPGAAADIWWAEDSELQELLPHRSFIDSSSATFRLLRPRAANAPLNLRLLNARALPLLLPAVLPPHWRGKPCVTARGDEVLVDGTPSRLLAAAAAGAGQAGAPRGGARQAGRQRGGGASRAPAMAKGGAKGGGRRGPNLGGSRHRGKRRGGAGGLDDYDADDWREEEWRDEDEDEEEEEEETEHEEAESISQVADQHGPAAEVAEEACVCHTAAELRGVVRRCELLWRVVENAHEKGANPLQVVSDFPCVPLVGAPDGAEEAPCLVSVHEAVRRRALSAEDFPQADRETLQRCGVLIARPGKRLRAALSLEKSSTLAALRVAFADRWQAEQRHPAEGPAPCRLHRGLQPLRVPVGQSRPLLALVSRFVEKGLVPRDPSLLQALPLYETRGGRFAVPLVPAGACVVAPSEDWDEVLEPDFADYLVSWDGEAGLALQALADRERGSAFLGAVLRTLGYGLCPAVPAHVPCYARAHLRTLQRTPGISMLIRELERAQKQRHATLVPNTLCNARWGAVVPGCAPVCAGAQREAAHRAAVRLCVARLRRFLVAEPPL
ncbi:unnamed protein product [Prorocentrum cordatum]|uniref:Uncharacterized protein n=1 Tax=Prorocentrum cordatum TaxID=2364126 RepID=A0ABN9TG23_9DINO|nr:unnamed protein product [Polarella glacialis]